MEDTIARLIEAWRANPNKMNDLRVFAIDDQNTFRFINSRWNKTHHMDAYGYAATTKLDRGKILSVFAKLEFLVNESIALALFLKKPDVMPHIKYFKVNERADIENLVQSSTPITCIGLSSKIQDIAFKKRIEYIEFLGVIGGDTRINLLKLADVRNFLAHEWDEKLAEYNSKRLSKKSAIGEFSKDIVSVFEVIINKYIELQKQIDYQSLLEGYVKRIKRQLR